MPVSSCLMLSARHCCSSALSVARYSVIAAVLPRMATSIASLCTSICAAMMLSRLPVVVSDSSTDSSAGAVVTVAAVPVFASSVSLMVVFPVASLSILLSGPAYLSTASVSSLLSTRVPAGRLTSSPRPLAPSILMEPSGSMAISRPSSPVSVRPSA